MATPSKGCAVIPAKAGIQFWFGVALAAWN
jgi:hypothetical protein